MNKTKTMKKRAEIEKGTAWKTEDLFSSDEKWEQEFHALSDAIPKLSQWSGKLGESVEQLYHCLQSCDEISARLERLYVYANLRFHEDSGNSFYQAMADRGQMTAVKYAESTAFLVPEILEIDSTKLGSFLTALNGMKQYRHFIENITRQKEHALSAKEEALLAKTSELSESPHQIFVMINDADIRFGKIKDEKGEETELTKGRYTAFMESKDRAVREEAFHALYNAYLKQKNTLASTYYSSVKKDLFYAQIRNYPSALAAALDDDKIPSAVYHTLIETVHRFIPLLHRYIKLRKQILGVDELHMYDLYAPLVSDIHWDIPYEEAKKTVLEGLAPLGKEYVQRLEKGFQNGWIDVYENEGKRGGAYSWGAYPGHPYVLMNYNNTINSMFTLAHEMGHALHSDYTWEKQPYIYSGHKIFVAEVASTVNEALLIEYLLAKTTEKKEKAFLINYFMEQFRGTFFRQTMFAEFEKKTHEMAEAGQPLTYDSLTKLYHDLNCFYYGEEMVVDEKIDIEWARIPHFYNAFYVYQYATGYSAAITLSRKILSEGEPAVKKYLDFLSKGNSEYSIDLLKGAGIDMTTAEPLERAMDVFKGLLDQMESLLS